MTTVLLVSGPGSNILVSIRVQSGKQSHCEWLWDKGFIIGIRSYIAVGPSGDIKVWNGDSH